MSPKTVPREKTVSREEWLSARMELLEAEKSLTRVRDELSALRRALPRVEVTEPYVFEGAEGKLSLADLFDRKSQLIVQHFMFGPDWEEGCPSCSFWVDNFNGLPVHLAHRDIAYVLASRAPFATLDAYRRRMGWDVRWVSSEHCAFNFDYGVSFTPEQIERGDNRYNFGTATFTGDEAPGISVFSKDPNGKVFHTYSTYARGLDVLNAAYHLMDLTPKGRDEDELPHPMAWLRRHDQYEE